MMTKNLLLLLFLLVSLASFGQASEASFDATMEAVYGPDGPGGTAIIVQDGKVLYHKGFGKANLELDVDMQAGHIFRIGSITKQFTAAAILKLAEKGKLSLEAPVTKFLPDYPTRGHTITVHHLLNHTSGIKSYTEMEKWDAEARRRDFTPREMIDYFKDEPMDFAPGEEFRYNNSGYFLLGYIIQKASGQPYDAYLRETFFEPLGMKHTIYGHNAPVVPGRVAGYQPSPFGGYQNADYLSMTQPYAAGSLLSNVEDLSTWYHAVAAGKVISVASRELAHTPTTLNDGEVQQYGYGWSLGEQEGSAFWGHGGGINGFATASRYFPEEKLFVAVFSNCNCNDPGAVASKLALQALGKYKEIKVISLSDDLLDKYEGKFELNPNLILTVTKKDGQLSVHATGQGSVMVEAYEEHKFFNEALNAKIQFNFADDGTVESLTLLQGGEYLCKRIE